MCTLSAIHLPENGLRVVMNRDELISRARAFPPSVVTLARRTALMPRDAKSGGTWIGVNDAGLIVALLNSSPPGTTPLDRPRSRGEITTRLLEAENLHEARRLAIATPTSPFGRFRALVFDFLHVMSWTSDGCENSIELQSLGNSAWFFTSSSLGDELVRPSREAVFDRLMKTPSPQQQDSLHDHRGQPRPEHGIRMHRSDAQTVSVTTIERSKTQSTLDYRDLLVPQDSCSRSLAHVVRNVDSDRDVQALNRGEL